MGCFTVLKSKKKKPEKVPKKRTSVKENPPTKLPEPENHGRSLQSAPPSFKTRAKTTQPTNRINISRARVLSAPSSLVVADQDPNSSTEFEEQGESKDRVVSTRDQSFSNSQPLPLPSPKNPSALKNLGSFKSSNSSSPVHPLPLPPLGGPRFFSFEEIAAACHNFSLDRCVSEGLSSMVFKASFGDDTLGSKKLETTVTCLTSTQGLKEFVNEVNTIAFLQHPHLCKLLGYHAQEGSDQRMLVYGRLYHGSLDRLLHARSDGPSIDWATRMKIALCAARGLAFLHEEGPFQAMYNEFSTANIQIDKDFTAKLSGYGCVSYNPETEILNASQARASISVETLERGLLTPKSNVWSFGIVLLELLTGRKNLDSRQPKEERNLVKWSRPYLADDCRLSLIMDPRLKGRFPTKAARTVADIALKCLQKEPSERPTMRTVVESLENIQDMKYSSRFPLQEPSVLSGKQVLRYPSFNGVITLPPSSNFSPSPSSRMRSVSPPRSSLNIPLPPRTCASTLSVEDIQISSIRRSPSPPLPRPGVEGF